MSDVLKIIKSVQEEIGAECEDFQEKGATSGGSFWQCTASYQGIYMFIQYDPSTHFLHLNANLGGMPAINIVPLYRHLLENSLTLINTNFAIDPSSNNIMVVANIDLKSLDTDLAGFLNNLFRNFYTNVLAVGPTIQTNFNLTK